MQRALLYLTQSGGELQVNAVFAQMGVGCIHFYTDYRNDVSYVTEKVRTALR